MKNVPYNHIFKKPTDFFNNFGLVLRTSKSHYHRTDIKRIGKDNTMKNDRFIIPELLVKDILNQYIQVFRLENNCDDRSNHDNRDNYSNHGNHGNHDNYDNYDNQGN